jgi:hypothetical protein
MKRPHLPLQIGTIEAAVTTWPTCGFPIPSDQAAARLVGKQRQLYETVRAAGSRGISSMSTLYADDPGGGPESPNIIAVMVLTVNLHLEHFGLAIRRRSGPGGLYRLLMLPTPTTTTEEKRSWLTTNPNPNCMLSSERRRRLLRPSL